MPGDTDNRIKWDQDRLKAKYQRITQILNSHKGLHGKDLDKPVKFTCLECPEDTVNHCKFAYSMYNVGKACIVREAEKADAREKAKADE